MWTTVAQTHRSAAAQRRRRPRRALNTAFVVLTLVVGCCVAGGRGDSLSTDPSPTGTGASSGDAVDPTAAGLRVAMRTYDECARGNDTLAVCLKRKAIAVIDRLERLGGGSLALGDGMRLEHTGRPEAAAAAAAAASPTDAGSWERSLPRSGDGRAAAVDAVLLERVAGLLDGRAVTVRLPPMSATDVGRAIEEGRGKMKKMMSMMMMGFMMKMATMVPVAIALLYALAGKALIVSKIALLLASIIAIKKLLSMKGGSSGGGGGHSSGGGGGGGGGGWSSGGGGGGGGWDRRSDEAGAQQMAYKAYATAIMQ